MGQLKSKKQFHILRKVAHCATGLLIVTCLWKAPFDQFQNQIIFISISVLGLALEVYRLKNERFNLSILKLVKYFAREEETRRISGLTYYFIATSICLLLIDKWLTGLFILYVAIGDPLAALIGKGLGKTKIYGDKTLAGTLTLFFVILVLNFVFIEHHSLVAIFGLALIASLAELLSPWDDNLSLPMVSTLFTFLLNY